MSWIWRAARYMARAGELGVYDNIADPGGGVTAKVAALIGPEDVVRVGRDAEDAAEPAEDG